jgi:hypothetical protein
MLSGMYLWELVGHDTSDGSVCSGIDDDLAAVMRACALLLRQGRGLVVRVVEVVPRMSVLSLDVIYVPTGREWLGRRTRSDDVHWGQTFRSVDPGAAYSMVASHDLNAVAS